MSNAPRPSQEHPDVKAVLIVDDSATARLVTRRCLEISGLGGATVIEAADGRAALELLRQQPVDLVLTDINMPRMDGRTLLRHIRASPRLNRLPVVVISSVGASVEHEDTRGYEAQAVITKPLTPAILARVLESLFAQLQARHRGWGGDAASKVAADLDAAVRDALEALAFSDTEARPLPPDAPVDAEAWALLETGAPHPGGLVLQCSRALARDLAATLHGVAAEQIDVPLLIQFLAELLNTVGGGFLRRVASTAAGYDIGLPRAGIGPAPRPDGALAGRWCYPLPGGDLSLALYGVGDPSTPG